MGEIDVVAAEPALADQHGDLGGLARCAERRRVDHHAREPRRQRQSSQLLSFVGDAAVGVDGAKFGEQRLRLDQRRRRRRVEETKLLGPRMPQAARSSANDDRSAARISGRANGSSEAVCGSSHSR